MNKITSKIKRSPFLKFFLIVALTISVVAYTFLRWDYHLSQYLFKQYCEEGRIGLFVYEKVPLSDDYFIPFPKDKEQLFNLSKRFVIDEDLVFDKTKLEEKYTFTYRKVVSISDIGPIQALETSVSRNADNKLLGKSISFVNGKGWWYRKVSSFGQPTVVHCPSGYDEKGDSNSGKLHSDLIKEVFYRY